MTTLNFAVTRNGEQIGSTTLKLQRNGDQTIAETATKVQVKIAFLTVYRYEQRLTERWVGGRLDALSAVTDDNGSIHRVSATRSGDKLAVNADGKVSQVDPAMMPANLWNVSLVRMTDALDPKDGSVMPVSVVDRGREQLVVQGRALTAHRYSIRTTIPQEVWYDENQRLLEGRAARQRRFDDQHDPVGDFGFAGNQPRSPSRSLGWQWNERVRM